MEKRRNVDVLLYNTNYTYNIVSLTSLILTISLFITIRLYVSLCLNHILFLDVCVKKTSLIDLRWIYKIKKKKTILIVPWLSFSFYSKKQLNPWKLFTMKTVCYTTLRLKQLAVKSRPILVCLCHQFFSWFVLHLVRFFLSLTTFSFFVLKCYVIIGLTFLYFISRMSSTSWIHKKIYW